MTRQTSQTRITTQIINSFHQADHVRPRVASSVEDAAPETTRPSAAPETTRPRPPPQHHRPPHSAPLAEESSVTMADRRRRAAAPAGPLYGQAAPPAGRRRPLATQAQRFAAAGPRL